jgi:hypothetical protein
VERLQFRPDRTAVAAVAVFFLGALYLALTGPWFAVLLLVPVGCLVWTLRAQVVADADGLEICNGLGRTRVPWEDVDAFELRKRLPVRLRRTEGRALLLTAVNKQDVRRLLAVTQR